MRSRYCLAKRHGRQIAVFATSVLLATILLAPPSRGPGSAAAPIATASAQAGRPSAAPAAPRTAQPDAADVAVNSVAADSAAGDSVTDAPESDAPSEPYPLSARRLADLAPGARLRLPDPAGGEIEFVVAAIEWAPPIRRLRLTHDGLPSTFTVKGPAFFGTLATPRGVYALEGHNRATRLVRQATLDQRNVHASDFRPAPA